MRLVDQGADRFSGGHPHDVAVRVQVEYDDRQPVVAAHRNRGRIHHAETLG